MNEDLPPQMLPPANANNTGNIKAGPKQIGKRNKSTTGPNKQGGGQPLMQPMIIMASKTFTQRLVEKITAKDVKMHLAVHAKIDALAKKALEGKPDDEIEVAEAYEWDKQPVNTKKKRVEPNPMDKTNQVYVSANEATWHQRKAGPIKFGPGHHVITDPPNGTRTVFTHSTREKAEEYVKNLAKHHPHDAAHSYIHSVTETLSPSASSGDWIHDFVHSKDPKFEGKSKKERIKMALGAYYSHHKESYLPNVSDHTKGIYHKTLTGHGFVHHSTTEHQFAGKTYTKHVYTHPSHGKSHVEITHWHGDAKPHHYVHRHEQSNGIMAPSSGENPNQLHRTLSRHYGVPKGMKPPKLTKWEHAAKVEPYKMNEEGAATDDRIERHDFVHVGFGQQGGPGFHGHVLRVKGRRAHIKAAHKEIGPFGPVHRTFIAPLHHVTILKKGGLEQVTEQVEVIESIEQVIPLLENFHHATADLHRAAMQKAKEAGNFELANFHEKQMEDHKAKAHYQDAITGANQRSTAKLARGMGENFANWHEKMEKHGTADKPVQFKIKNAGGRTEAHLNGKRLGSYNHEKRIEEARKRGPAEFHPGQHVRFSGRSLSGDLEGDMTVKVIDPHSNKHEVHKVEGGREYNKQGHRHLRTATVEREAFTSLAGKHYPARRTEVHHHNLHESVSGETMIEAVKRKYIGKTRGTTATGKPAHAVIIDPVIKAEKDQNLATMKANAKMPVADRGL